MSDPLVYVRFRSPEPDGRGRFVGVFGLVNAAARDGLLDEEQERFRRTNNDWYDRAYPNPNDIDPTVYDGARHPLAAAWFKSTAIELIARVDGYLAICEALQIPCVRVESTDPGRIVYEDPSQVVVVPYAL